MRRLFHAGGSVVTGDRIAGALMSYAGHLLSHRETDVVAFPIVDADGIARQAEMLIGPGMQLLSVPEEVAFDEPVDDVLVERLERRRTAISMSVTPEETTESRSETVTHAGFGSPPHDEDVWGLDRYY
ncbi:hypothetical protein [Herbiconiux solani]|uniref:hypothetical protein n=1 Tax=Herbiconiux solani TaxID=661329 RepID=UPI0008260EFD|nr:hypothetical protein [Herbiconiux solani]